MTERDARRIAELLRDYDVIVEWYDETIAVCAEHEKFPLIEFSGICATNGEASNEGWDGDLRLSRWTVARMFGAAKVAVVEELGNLGVNIAAPDGGTR